MTAPARIIFVSSDIHDPAATKMGRIAPPRYGPIEDLARGTGTAAKLQPMARYGTAKMYAMMGPMNSIEDSGRWENRSQ
jgi:hypothetical protein